QILVFLAAVAATSLACSCLEQTPEQAFCSADWVARVKINSRTESYPDGSNFYNIQHDAEIVEMFKKPSSLSSLPSSVYGSTICNLCNVDAGKEFLLAGTYYDDKLKFSLC
ncbi:hypothetical protein PFISCL1PPCAC_188, partial [Pristionchus fissidentatus]